MTEAEIKLAREVLEQAARMIEFRKYDLPVPRSGAGPFTIRQQTANELIRQVAASLRAMADEIAHPDLPEERAA